MNTPPPDIATDRDLRALWDKFEQAGQAHVFGFWSRLTPSERNDLRRQLERVDWAQLAAWQKQIAQTTTGQTSALPSILDAEAPEIIDSRQPNPDAVALGHELLRRGRVAALTVAGGQASRLGIDIPKGCLEVGPVTRRSLFELFARQIAAVGHTYGRPMPWLIMTSPGNHSATVEFFERHQFFGLPRDSVRFFTQGEVPALSADGRLLLASPSRLFLSPDGHGGTLTALRRHDLLGWLAGMRADTLSYFQVDNLQVRLADPLFIGLHHLHGCEFSTKVVSKRDAAEKVGVFVKRPDGRLAVVEYSDMRPEDQTALAADGHTLKFRAGNTAIHLLDVAFVARVTRHANALPFHIAHKAVRHLDPTAAARGEEVIIEPTVPNAYKFETFVFDAMPLAHRGILLEIDRPAEFVPIKSATGPDSPAAAHSTYVAYWTRVLDQLGLTVPRTPTGEPVNVEVDPAFVLDAPEFKRLAQRLRSFHLDPAAAEVFIAPESTP